MYLDLNIKHIHNSFMLTNWKNSYMIILVNAKETFHKIQSSQVNL